MLVNIHQITEEGFAVDLERQNSMVDAIEGLVQLEPVRAHFALAWEAGHLHISGEISTVVKLPCSRCYKEFPLPVSERFDFLTLPSGNVQWPESQELGVQDMEVSFLQGDVIDLDELIRENIYLALPIQPLCSEACPGLCPRCGADRSEEVCSCPPEKVDPRFRALEILRRRIDLETKGQP